MVAIPRFYVSPKLFTVYLSLFREFHPLSAQRPAFTGGRSRPISGRPVQRVLDGEFSTSLTNRSMSLAEPKPNTHPNSRHPMKLVVGCERVTLESERFYSDEGDIDRDP